MIDWFWTMVVVAILLLLYLGAAAWVAKKEGLWGPPQRAGDLALRRTLLLASFAVSLAIAPTVGTLLYVLLYEALFRFQAGTWLPFGWFGMLWPSDPLTDWSDVIDTTFEAVSRVSRGETMPLLAFRAAFAIYFAFAGPRLIFRGLRRVFAKPQEA
jgi:hypothetical protein